MVMLAVALHTRSFSIQKTFSEEQRGHFTTPSGQRRPTMSEETRPMANPPSTPVFQQPTAVERAFNRLFGFLVGLGLGLKHNYLLQVRGRKSGRLYSTPINLVEIGGKRFLVAPRGQTQWVRNAEAAGEVTLQRGRSRQSYGLRPLVDEEKPELRRFTWTASRAPCNGTFPFLQVRPRRILLAWPLTIPYLN